MAGIFYLSLDKDRLRRFFLPFVFLFPRPLRLNKAAAREKFSLPENQRGSDSSIGQKPVRCSFRKGFAKRPPSDQKQHGQNQHNILVAFFPHQKYNQADQ